MAAEEKAVMMFEMTNLKMSRGCRSLADRMEESGSGREAGQQAMSVAGVRMKDQKDCPLESAARKGGPQ